MLRVAIAQSEGTRTHAVLADVFAQCEAQLHGSMPQAGVLVASAEFDYQAALTAIVERFPGIALIGGTVRGAMCGPAGYAEDALSLMLLGSDTITIRAGLGRDCSRDIRAAVRQALDSASQGLDGPARLCIAIPEVFSADANDVVATLGAQLGSECVLFGSVAGRTWTAGSATEGATQFFATEVLKDALPVLLFSGPIDYAITIENSWTPIGTRQRVTMSAGRDVARIGERTALAYYHHYLGSHTEPAIEFPLAVFDGDSDNYYVRVPQSYDADTGVIRYSGAIPTGAIVQLTEAVRPHMLEQTEAAIRRAVESLGPAQPVLAMIASCGIRRLVLGTQVSRESDIVRRILPNVPSFGMYSAGEIAPLAPGRPSIMHQATLVALVIGIRGESRYDINDAAKDGIVDTIKHDVIDDSKHDIYDKSPRPWRAPVLPSEAPRDRAFLQQRLTRSEALRARLEFAHERDHAMLRTIGEEIAHSRELIRQKNRELEQLYAEIEREKQKTDELLLNILPGDVADELKRTGHVEPVYYDSVTVLFTDFKDFSRIAARMSPHELIRDLDYYFSAFDSIIERHGLEKLKTIGDAYMCAGGIPTVNQSHPGDAVRVAWEIQEFMTRALAEARRRGNASWELRIGVHTGPLMAGVIGNKKFAYDIWGDTVNIAARMESSGAPGRINISRATYERVREHFACEPRGRIAVKNVGEVDMYFVLGPT